MIHTDFDPEKTAVIEPSEFYHPMENMPEALIGRVLPPAYGEIRGGISRRSHHAISGLQRWRTGLSLHCAERHRVLR